MDKYIKQFIEKYKNLLADEDFTSLYRKAYKEMTGYPYIGSLTQIFLDLDIDSLDYMSKIPTGYLAGAAVKSVDIPDHITSIGMNAFNECKSLTSITIPDSVTSIGEWAFKDCSSLTNINFKGTTSQWREIKKDEDWKKYSSLKAIFCTMEI